MKVLSFNHLSVVLFILCLGSMANTAICQNQGKSMVSTYQISGTIEQPTTEGKIVLSSYDPVSQVKTEVESTTVNSDGSFSISYPFTEPDLYRVDFFNNKNVMLVVGKGQSDITLNMGGAKGAMEIQGSPDSEKLLAYDSFRSESLGRLVKPTYATMRSATEAKDQMAEIAAVEAYAEASEAHRVELLDFSEKELGTSLALYGSVLRWTGDDETARLDMLVKNFSKVHPDLKMTKVMQEKVERFKKVAIGAIAPPIVLPDSSGQTVDMKDILGKYTLLDFWASWCGPCLLQIPDLHAAYDAFHDSGFEIIGVSVDKNGDKWKKAINKYEMNWPQLSDLKGWSSEAAADYNVTFIPFNMLIDENGKILAKNLHSKSLNKKLKELLGDH